MLAFNMKSTQHVRLKGLDDPCTTELEQWREKIRTATFMTNGAESCLSDLLKYHECVALAEFRGKHKGVLTDTFKFSWHDAFATTQSMAQADWALERAAVLFNIAAAQSYLATQQDRSTAEGTKQAAKFFQEAAGSINAARELTSQAPWLERTPDLSNEFLSALSTLMLAQAQKCFYEKAVSAAMKDGTVALLAAECAALYEEVSLQLSGRALTEAYATVAKDWLQVVQWNRRSFDGMQHYYAATTCLERYEYGAQVSRLIFAAQRCGEAVDLCKGANPVLQEQFQRALTLARERLQKAQHDNDTVYYDKVPPLATLPKLERKPMVKPIRLEQLNVAEPPPPAEPAPAEPAPAVLLTDSAAAAAMAELTVSQAPEQKDDGDGPEALPPPPSFEAAISAGVQELIQMGFSKEKAEATLDQANGSVTQAAEMLLSQAN